MSDSNVVKVPDLLKGRIVVETVNISKKEYESLLDDSLFLNCLRRAGVDNWQGWDDACEEYHEKCETEK
jgi:hypothetical protein